MSNQFWVPWLLNKLLWWQNYICRYWFLKCDLLQVVSLIWCEYQWHCCFSAKKSLARQRTCQRRCWSNDLYTPFTYMDFLTSSYGSHIQGSVWFSNFSTDLRVIKTIYGLLRCIYYDVFTAKFHDLLRDFTNTYEQHKGILQDFYKLFRVYYGMLIFIKACTY